MSTAIELRGVEKTFGITSVIRNVSLTVAQGERHALIGPNGAGKSTLFNLISGYMKPSVGSILLRDQVISGLPPFQINRRGLSRSFQVTNVFAKMTVWENLRCAVLWLPAIVTRSGRMSITCPRYASAPRKSSRISTSSHAATCPPGF
jgi:branched-chain amino acid transport system ATP-binding protein